MADPRRQYQRELGRYGLGLGGMSSGIGQSRSPFAEEGPAAGGYSFDQEVYPDDPLAGLTLEESMDLLTTMGIDPSNPALVYEGIIDRASRRPESVLPNIPADVEDFSDFASAYGDVMAAIEERPETTSTPLTPNEMFQNMETNPSAFDLDGPEAVLDPAAIAEIDAALEKASIAKPRETAEDFRQKEAQIAEIQGGLKSMPVAEAEAITEQMFTAAMQDFIQEARGTGPDIEGPRSLEDYKKEFAEATGIDISGKPDKSQALMAFGLALMQNKAGKGFNISKMLGEVGVAGEAAMPALEKAKERARQDGIAAGKYALEMRSADTAKAEAARERAMERSNYFVVPRSDDIKGFLAGIGEGRGRLESLSKYELNRLQNNPEFTSKFDILPASTWATVVGEAMKTPEAQDLYLTSAKEIPLFEGAESDLFKIRVYDPDPNKNPNGQPVIAGNGQDQYEALARIARDNQRVKEQFIELGILNEGTSIYRYTIDSLNSLGSAFGLQFGNDVPETQRMKMILEKMQAKNAPAILGELGKTISDSDRARVASIVGTITPTTDPRELQAKFEELFNDIILGAEADILQGLTTLDRYTGRSVGGALDGSVLSEDEQKELKIGLEALGVK